MRWPVLLLAAVGVTLASCNGTGRSAEEAAAEANLLDPATVNAILGANIPSEELAPGNDLDANAVAENGSAEVNQSD
jgi:hypothetical protein